MDVLPPSLTIAIPTYKRSLEFARLLRQVSTQILELPEPIQAMVSIVIHDNPSEASGHKHNIFRSLDFGRSHSRWVQNQDNIGADANINQAYASGLATDYVWTIGDDEQLFPNAIKNILRRLSGSPEPALLILFGDEYPLEVNKLGDLCWPSYHAFAADVVKVQPHVLIAHSLISLNVIKSSIYDPALGETDILLHSKRWGLLFCFSHMKAIVGGLSRDDASPIHIVLDSVIDCSVRAPSHVPEVETPKMHRLYAMHIFWLVHEFGLPLSAFYQDALLAQCISPDASSMLRVLIARGLRRPLKRVRSLFRLAGQTLFPGLHGRSVHEP